ncbi:DEAD/DEAH box helicase [Serinicoccus marinus]|uniref:DEAD/DEAH box helicase n=1 Tax=Serinicoccus marinus TaxID=247333 RepID=UPI001375A2C9|nr:SNF2-related protein [Serinicoccus marinus]
MVVLPARPRPRRDPRRRQGLGKTLQVLTAAERLRAEGRLSPREPLLVVAPASVVATWQREAARFTPRLEVAALTQTTRRTGRPLDDLVAGAHVVVTSYTLLRIEEEHLVERAWGGVVLDEAQAVKNHRSRTYQVARRLGAPVKIAVTGTPLENSLMDLWALLSIVAPGLFSSPERFSTVFRRPIESGTAPELLDTLRRRIRPLVLRRTKESVAADLPPKIEQVVSVPLNPPTGASTTPTCSASGSAYSACWTTSTGTGSRSSPRSRSCASSASTSTSWCPTPRPPPDPARSTPCWSRWSSSPPRGTGA